jgi:hypothetical protein
VKPDQRSFRIAVLADQYVNPVPGGLDGLAVAARAGWGVVQLPAADYPDPLAARILTAVAEQLAEFGRHGYDIVLVGERDGLADALAAAGQAMPDQMTPAGAAELHDFLAARPAPTVSDWSWLAGGPGVAGGPG